MNSLMQGRGGPRERIRLSVGSNYKLSAWRAGFGCGNRDQGPGSHMVGRIV